MRITLVLLSRGDGGLEKHTRELCNALTERRHTVTLISDPELQNGLDNGVQFMPIDIDRSRRNPLLWFDLLKQIRRSRPDLLHAQAHKAAAVLSLLKPWLHRPLVASVHGIKQNNHAFWGMDQVICVSQEAKARIDHPHCQVIYNGIAPPDTAQLWRRDRLVMQFNLQNVHPCIGLVARLEPVKGVDLAIQAADGLPLDLLIIGDGTERDRLEMLASRSSTPSQFHFTGYRGDVMSLLPALDAILISSQREGFSYVLAEALISGTPVISTDVAGPREFLPGDAIVGQASVEKIRSGLERWLKDPATWRARQQKAFQRAQRELTMQAMVRQTLELYQSLLQEGAGKWAG